MTQPERLEPTTGIVRIVSETTRAAAADAITIEQALEAMLDAGHAPNLAFQPIVDLQRGVTVGYEALSRFPGPPNAGPDRWFAAAHAMGRAPLLEALVVERALSFRRALPDNCFLSINVAPEALLDQRVQRLLSGQSLSRLVFELTEHSAVTDYDLLSRAIAQVRASGAFVAVDDAGAGYASLQHILMLRPDFVKLDRALIAGLQHDEAKAALIEMFGGFTSRTDAWLLAEGIEERNELTRLAQLGVPLGQGYYLGRPVPEMRALDPRLGDEMRGAARDASEAGTVAQLFEQHICAPSDESDERLAAIFAQDTRLSAVVLVDASRRPASLVLRAEHGFRREPLMCVLDVTAAVDALGRALTRHERNRFDPLACCDELGKYRGLVRIERLIEDALPKR